MLIYDTLSKIKKPFVPRKHGIVEMFVCGPTVYDNPHIGHGRCYVSFDVIAKYLQYLGYDVTFNINVTDIDDKVIRRAQEDGISYENIARRYGLAFDDALYMLGIDSISGQFYATDAIDYIVGQISELESKGFTYMLKDGLYFDLSKFPESGKLSGRIGVGLEESEVSRIGARTDKRNPGDFVLWKLEKPGEREVGAVWDENPDTGEPIPWGPGRPGWHIEDTAITNMTFGPQYDIHGGGVDLIFPHHEAEICQMESASGLSPLVNYWMHNGHLMIDKHKMSKSLNNFMAIEEAIGRWGSHALRYFFISAHYRSALNFTDEALDGAVAAVERLNNFILTMKQWKEKGPEPTQKGQVSYENTSTQETSGGGVDFYHIDDWCYRIRKDFERAMNNDFSTSAALRIVFMYIKSIYDRLEKDRKTGNKGGCNQECFSRFDASLVLEALYGINQILGIMNFEVEVEEEIEEMVRVREGMRAEKKWDESDALRSKINALGYRIDDTPAGTIICPLSENDAQI